MYVPTKSVDSFPGVTEVISTFPPIALSMAVSETVITPPASVVSGIALIFAFATTLTLSVTM